MKIAVTGGSGKLGSAVVTRLRDEGNFVVNLDANSPREHGSLKVDFTDYGQTIDALLGVNDLHDGFDALVHLAAVPAPAIVPDVEVFRNNMLSSFHLFQAARRAGIRNIVTASSETVLGLPFDTPPAQIPVTEELRTRPETIYSLVKHLEETMAVELCRWDPELKIVALRFSNVFAEADYAQLAAVQDDALLRKWNLWSYIDARDGAQAVSKALAWQNTGFEAFIIANADTVMNRPNAELIAEVFPDAPVVDDRGPHGTLFSIDKAREKLGYEPEFSWRDR